VLDTGSTDRTLDVLAAATTGWPGQVHRAPWSDFSTGRNMLSALVRTDWVLYLDADHELIEADHLRDELTGPFDAQRVASLEQPVYCNPRLVRAGVGTWRGRTHEALDLGDAVVGLSTARVRHHGDGGSRAGKLERDEVLLRADLAQADTPRTRFYLGSTLLGLNQPAEALVHLRVAELSPWGEERYVASMYIARAHAAVGNRQLAAAQYAHAARLRPGRFEACFEAVRAFNQMGRPDLGAHVGTWGLSFRPRVADVLFVHAHAHALASLETAHAMVELGNLPGAQIVLGGMGHDVLPPGLRPVLTALQTAASPPA
jgi:hypothetical protein